MNSITEHYVISFFSEFSLLFFVTLVMFKMKNEKTNQFFWLILWIKNLKIWLSTKLNSGKSF